MGSVRLPQAQLSEIKAPAKRDAQTEAILAIGGNNPFAQGLNLAVPEITDALAKRAELKRKTKLQANQLARLEQLGGEDPGAYAGLDPTQAASFASANRKSKTDVQEEARKLMASTLKVRALEKQFGYKENELGDDHPSALMKVQNDLASQRQKDSTKGKNKQVGVTADGRAVSYNQQTQSNETPDGKEYTGPIFPVDVGVGEQRVQGLVTTGKSAVQKVKSLLTPSVLSELKAIRFTPGKVYAQLASPEAKKLYTNLRRAMENEVYLRTGAAANSVELENSLTANLAAIGDDIDDFNFRMDYLDESLSNFSPRSNVGVGLKKIKSLEDDLVDQGLISR